MTGHAACNLMPVVAANRIGTEEVVPCAENGNQSSALTFYGSSFITDATGEVVEQMDRVSEGFILHSFDLDELESERKSWGLFRDLSLIHIFQSMNLKEWSRKMRVSNIPINQEFREDVRIMCNLSTGIEERATERATEKTSENCMLNMYKKGYTLDQIADVAETGVDEVEAIIKKKEPAMA